MVFSWPVDVSVARTVDPSAGPQAASLPAPATEPTEITEQAPASSNLSPVTVHCLPFLGFQFLGFTPEQDHVRNYAAEAQSELDAQSKRLNRLNNPRHAIEMLMSPEHQRYLKGE